MTYTDNRADLTLLRPGDAGYDDELAGFQTGFRQRPAVVVAARSSSAMSSSKSSTRSRSVAHM